MPRLRIDVFNADTGLLLSSTIKTVASLPQAARPTQYKTCEECHGGFVVGPDFGQSTKRFCSEPCRRAWWRRDRQKATHAARAADPSVVARRV